VAEILASEVLHIKISLCSTGPQLQKLGLSPYLTNINLEVGQHKFRMDKKPTPYPHRIQKSNIMKSLQRWILTGVRSSNGKIHLQGMDCHSQEFSHTWEQKKRKNPVSI